jgi:predicted AlkP superfamily phosphohydrolase/phosphomutase
MSSRLRVLAVGIDAAEPTLVLDLIERGQLPALAELRRMGTWRPVRSVADLGSGAVWPTFFTGTPPAQHGVHGGWAWRPDLMRVEEVRTAQLRPFWRAVEEEEGLAVGVLDVPFAPAATAAVRGFDVTQWGAHDRWLTTTAVAPESLRPALSALHPFAGNDLQPVGPDDRVALDTLGSACVEGARLKGDVARLLLSSTDVDMGVVVFGEAHRASHDLWQTLGAATELHADIPVEDREVTPGLVDVYREIDRQVGRLVEDLVEGAATMVFSLHGFRPGRGIVDLLQPVLEALGHAVPVSARRSLARTALAGLKRRTPVGLKRVYHRRVPRSARYRLAGPTMIPALDWARTRAFALPTDQHGWVRVNLRGREAQGAVAPHDYEPLLADLTSALEELADEDGRPLVHEVLRPGLDGESPEALPDLVVHWTDAALSNPVRVAEPGLEVSPIGPRITGQHRAEGFCLTHGIDAGEPGEVATTDLHRLLRPARR